MILSHCAKRLVSFSDMPTWGVVLHGITKFSSSLFILVFGVSVAVVYLPKVGTPEWPAARIALWKRGLLVMLSYKLLTVVQLFQDRPQAIADALLFKRFPDYVEVLEFYGWFVLLLPFILPVWKKLPLVGRVGMFAAFAVGSELLRAHWDFFGVWQLKAILIEQKGVFCFGVLTRGAMALFGLLLAELLVRSRSRERGAQNLGLLAIPLGCFSWIAFMLIYGDNLPATLLKLAHNWGKHPPNAPFLLYSMGGALILLGCCLLLKGAVTRLFTPFLVIGRESLFAFNFHIVFIWVGYRYLFGLQGHVTYLQSLWLTLAVFVLAALGAYLNTLRKRSGRARSTRPGRQDLPSAAPTYDHPDFPGLTREEVEVVLEFAARVEPRAALRGARQTPLAGRATV